jgi:hypothetical protein
MSRAGYALRIFAVAGAKMRRKQFKVASPSGRKCEAGNVVTMTLLL